MRVGSIKKTGEVRHLWDVMGDLSYRRCGGKQWQYTTNIDFTSDKPACNGCITKDQTIIADAKRNLAKLGVK